MSILRRRPGVPRTLITLIASLGAVATAVPASAAESQADLSVDLALGTTRIPLNGKTVPADIHVANAGAASADGIVVTFEIPATAIISGEGPSTDSPWQCTLGRPVRCTHPTLTAGQSAAPLRLPVRLSEGVDGQSAVITASVTTTSQESSTMNNLDSESVTYDASLGAPDLRVESVIPIPDHRVIEGDWVKYPMNFRNSGDIPAADVRARVVAAPGLLWGVGDQSDPRWQCTTVVESQEWDCAYGSLSVGSATRTLSFSGRMPAGGQPGDRLPVTVTLSTSTPGEDPAGNVHEGGFEYATPAYVSGRVWLDVDRDGQRDAGEGTPAPNPLSVSLVPVAGGAAVYVPVNADGTYRMPMRAGQYLYRARFVPGSYQFTTPNVGDDATDSDVYVVYDSGDQVVAESDLVSLSEGEEATIDIGLVTVG
ncbi:SdrD B-like domain-containing protein [Micromonospora sp. NPDC047074]|uniref:SdrD B-like domain-containing protein n=1 Tax=Micromonospora sp. NPDC047074 TaxID=3154339 RepID=UPI0033C5A9AA